MRKLRQLRKTTLRISVVFLSFMILIVSLFALLPETVDFGIKEAYALPGMFPTDGDSWTENDNASYTWRCQSPYLDDLQFVQDKAWVGSYSLRANNTAGTYFGFELDIGELTDFSSYKLLTFYFKLTYSSTITIEISPSSWGSTTLYFRANGISATEGRFAIPLHAFIAKQDVSLTSLRYIRFTYGPMGDADASLFYIDGLHFSSYEESTVENPPSDVYLANYFSEIPRFQHKVVVHDSEQYTSLWAVTNVTTGEGRFFNLETEALSQTIFGLALAYNYTKSPQTLSEVNLLADWLCQMRRDDVYGGVRDYYSNATQTFAYTESGVNGWALAALSLAYYVTSNSSYKTVCDDMRHFLVDHLWNETNGWFDYHINVGTGAYTYTNAWSPMLQGGAVLGLACYYRFVSQNSTIPPIVEKAFNTLLSQTSYYSNRTFSVGGALEDSTYWWWAMYESWKAFNNSTYKTWCKALEQLAASAISEPSGRKIRYYGCFSTRLETETLDNWGACCYAPLALLLYLEDQEALTNIEKLLLDYFRTQTSAKYLVPRLPNIGGKYERWQTLQWSGQGAFLYSAMAIYYTQVFRPSDPYCLLTTGEITSSSYTDDKLTFHVNASTGQITTTEVYCGEKGKPTRVLVDDVEQIMDYDTSSKILTVAVAHSSSSQILVDWTPPDVAITSIVPSATEVYVGQIVNITVVARNEGNVTETFRVATYYCKATATEWEEIDMTWTVTDLAPGSSRTLPLFVWRTEDLSIGEYRIKANATIVEGEIDVDDNEKEFEGAIKLSSHDIAVTALITSQTEVVVGESVNISVTVENQGSFAETFDVTVKYDDTIIETRIDITLEAGASTVETFTWGTTGVSEGNHTISAEVPPVLDEADTADNTYIDREVTVKGSGTEILLYAVAGIAIAILAIVIYVLKIRKPKQTLQPRDRFQPPTNSNRFMQRIRCSRRPFHDKIFGQAFLERLFCQLSGETNLSISQRIF